MKMMKHYSKYINPYMEKILNNEIEYCKEQEDMINNIVIPVLERDDVYIDEKIRLQGIIDCFFEEEDGIVLLDYKTDYVEEGNEDEIIERYRSQLKYYKDALEKITGKRVKESYLYLFGIDKGVLVKE